MIAIIALVISGLVAIGGGLWAFFKFFSNLIKTQFDQINNRADLTDELIRDLSTQLSRMQGSRVALVTSDICKLNTEKYDEKIDHRFREVREDLRGELNAVEERLVTRIEKLEDR
jgi:hypothetical protein